MKNNELLGDSAHNLHALIKKGEEKKNEILWGWWELN